MSVSLLLTAQPRSMSAAVSELRALEPGIQSAGLLSDGISILKSDVPFITLARACMRRPPVFAQHICPNDAILPPDAAPEAVCAAVAPLIEGAAPPLAVQARFVNAGEGAPAKRALADALEGLAAGMSLGINNRAPVTVVSVCAAQGGVYVGVSEARHNLCARGGRAHGFGRLEEKISRSELKLLEALETFGITPPAGGRALDLGAAPGGWAHALAGFGLTVDAVDPALLNASLYGDALIEHRRMTAQAFLASAPPDSYDMLVNDMRMDARDSCALMLAYRRKLKPGGMAVMTVKLPDSGYQSAMSGALRALSAAYTVTGARQLYHNRSEATVALRNDG